LIINKTDLIPSVPFDLEYARKEALEMNPKLKIFTTSALKDSGIDELVEYFLSSLRNLRQKNA
jgi:hydrogenase nickel incorporation protein HypB